MGSVLFIFSFSCLSFHDNFSRILPYYDFGSVHSSHQTCCLSKFVPLPVIFVFNFLYFIFCILFSPFLFFLFWAGGIFCSLTCYFSGMTGQSLHSVSALQSVCCSFVLFLMCCLLTLLWIRSENILDQVILQGC